ASPSRFARAQRQALDVVSRLGAGAEVMVIEAAVQPRVLAPFSHERDQTLAAIRGAHATDLPNRLGEAVRTARALVGQDSRAEIHVFTDGAHPAALRGQADDVRVRWVGVGLRARLNVSDDLAADATAYAIIPPVRMIQVLLVSAGNLFLEKELSTDPQVKLEVRKPDAYQGGMENFDVVVLDSFSPARIGSGRFVLVNTSPPDVPLEVLGRLESPVIMDWDRNHPIMRQVDFAKVAIEDAMRVRPLAAGKTLVEAVGGPIVYLLEEPNRKAVFFGFDLFRSDLPLRVAFPVMMSRALRWLHPADLEQA